MSEKKRKVLFLYNGGTIGQILEIKDVDGVPTEVLVPPKDEKQFKDVCTPIIEKIQDKANIEIVFELVTTKDSTNMSPNDWEKLALRIKKAQDHEEYDAIGVAHGTDTLAYTAVALALALHGKEPEKSGLQIPVVITGGQNSIYKPGGDARFNLENLFCTIDEAMNFEIADVLVNFWNRVLLGCRTLKINEKDFDAFISPAFPDVGNIDANGVRLKPEYLKKKADAAEKIMLAPKFGRGIISLELNPGLEPDLIRNFIMNGGIAAMVFKSLGEGNVCSEGEYSLIPIIKEATEEYATPILITTKFVGGSAGAAHYDVGLQAIKAGGIICYDHTDVAVDVKAKWLLGNAICADDDGFRKAMATSYAGEVTPSSK